MCISGEVFIGKKTKKTTRMGFEPTRAEHIGLAVQRLNHSATSSVWSRIFDRSNPFPVVDLKVRAKRLIYLLLNEM